jgi:hypothetical protein
MRGIVRNHRAEALAPLSLFNVYAAEDGERAAFVALRWNHERETWVAERGLHLSGSNGHRSWTQSLDSVSRDGARVDDGCLLSAVGRSGTGRILNSSSAHDSDPSAPLYVEDALGRLDSNRARDLLERLGRRKGQIVLFVGWPGTAELTKEVFTERIASDHSLVDRGRDGVGIVPTAR